MGEFVVVPTIALVLLAVFGPRLVRAVWETYWEMRAEKKARDAGRPTGQDD